MAKSKLARKEVKHIGRLVQLDISDREIKKYPRQLSEILDYVGLLSKINTSKIDPVSQVTRLENVFREDVLTKSLSQARSLSGAKRSSQGYFNVSSVIKK